MLSVRHSSLVHADLNAISKLEQSSAVRGMVMTTPLATNNCAPHVEGTMKNTPIMSRTVQEGWQCAALLTDVSETNVTSVGGATHLVTFIDEASGNSIVVHMKTQGEVAALLKPHLC